MEWQATDDRLLELEDPQRRLFTLASIRAVLGGVTITILGCGDDGPTSPSPTTQGDISGNVSANHGHAAVITGVQLATNNAVALQIRGMATHPHTVELSSQEVGQIAARQRVSKASSVDDSPDAGVHSHTVIFN